eukprot:evm.model.scf_554.3 EVM.evm.TU.scf_554.3   scf_554:45299-63774(+)
MVGMAGAWGVLAAALLLFLAPTGSGSPSIPAGAGRRPEGGFQYRRLRQDLQASQGTTGEDANADTGPMAGLGHAAPSGIEYVVSVERPCYPGQHLCSGALIDPMWVLTAASCLHNRQEHLDDHFGSVPLAVRAVDPRTAAQEVVPVHEQIFRPDWNGKRADGNDIALLKLESPLGSAFRSIPVADEGIDVLGGPLLEILKYSGQGVERVPDVGIVPNEGCNRLRQEKQLSPVTEDMTCSYAFGLNTTAGLNGGLLVFMNVSNTTQSNEEGPRPGSLMGVASFDRSNRLRSRDLPIVFANVAHFSKWIHSEMANGSATEPSAGSLEADDMERIASRIVVHPSWVPATRSGPDVAMVRLEKPVDNVSIPRLADSTVVLPPLLSVVGWPGENSTSMVAGSLHYADVIPVSKEVCAEFYAEDRLGSVVCAVGVKLDVCEGYSGGPLLLPSAPHDAVIDGQPKDDEVVGIVSFGPDPCTEAQVPIVFTNIGEGDVLAWIDSRLKAADHPTLSPDEQNPLDEELLLLARSKENSTTQSMVDSLLNNGADPNAGNADGVKILHEAAASDNLIVAEAVLAAGALVDVWTIHTREGALHIAANKNSTRVARALINAGAAVNLLTQDGKTPLHFATEKGHSLMTDLLLVGGADWAVRTVIRAQTALHLAANRNAPIVALLLIRAGADVNALNDEWQTPLHIAAVNGQIGVAAVLMMAGANQSAVDKYGSMPKDIICDDDFAPEMCKDEDRRRLMELLIPVEPPKAEDDEEALLQLAGTPASNSSAQGANALLDKGVNANACCNTFNGTALHEAAHSNNAPVAQALIAAGADIDAMDAPFQNTPLHDCARWNSSEVLEALIKAGAGLNAANVLGETPLHVAAMWGSTEVADLLIANKALVNVSDSTGEHPLHSAAHGNSRGVAALLIEGGAKLNAQNFHGDTPLHLAAAYGRLGLAQMLMESGANASLENFNGLTPFDVACQRERELCNGNQDVEPALKTLLDQAEDEGPTPPSYSYVAAIRNGSGAHQCTGILVKENWVLTSASCGELGAPDGQLGDFFGASVFLGVGSNIDNGTEVMAPLSIKWQNKSGDTPALALIELPTPSNHDPVQLATRLGPGGDLIQDLALASGLGLTAQSGGDLPQAAQLAFWPNANCNASWPWNVEPNMWCAYGLAKECSNVSDIGTPLITATDSTKPPTQPVLLGMMLEGELCLKNMSRPAVFANVTAEETACWISETIQDLLPDFCIFRTASSNATTLKSEGIAAIIASLVIVTASILVLVLYWTKRGRKGNLPQDSKDKKLIEPGGEYSPTSSGHLNDDIFNGSPWDNIRPMQNVSPWDTGSGIGANLWSSSPGTIKTLPDDLEVELLGKDVGKGAFSRVEEGLLRDANGMQVKVVVKRLGEWCFDAVDRAVSALRNELEVLERVSSHPNIIKCYGGNLQYAEPLQEGVPDVYIVEELMDSNLSTLIHGNGGSVNGSSRKGPDLVFSHLLKIFSGIVAGLEHLHDNNVVHYDLKPANVLLDREHNVKLADFGCSKIKVQSYVTAGFAGTMMYMAPECWFSKFVPNLHVRFQNIDIYSLGVVMWECITGNRPDSTSMSFPMEDAGVEGRMDSLGSQAGHMNEMHVRSRFPMSDELPRELCELVWSCLAFENHRRPDCTEIRDRLEEFMSAEWVNSFPSHR